MKTRGEQIGPGLVKQNTVTALIYHETTVYKRL